MNIHTFSNVCACMCMCVCVCVCVCEHMCVFCMDGLLSFYFLSNYIICRINFGSMQESL